MPAPRLRADTLAALPADVARPDFDRAALRSGIVHLGLGAFARAHLAVVNDAAIAANADSRWGIVGVSLRQPDTRDALMPQGGLYTLALRDADAAGRVREQLQVIGCVQRVMVAPEDPLAVLESVAAADTRIVSLTITEKGYCHDPASGSLRFDLPDIAHDLAHPRAPRSAIGLIVHGLRERRQRGFGPITVLSLDNLPSNGDMLRGLVLAFANALDPALHDWVAAACTFPNSMVDRIVPPTTDADRERIAARLGLHDAWPVVAEPFLDWVVEDRFAAGRPDWAAGGARFVGAAKPFETLKLRCVNGTHSALAYLGVLAGWATVDRALAQPALRGYLLAMLRDEIAPTLPTLPGLDLDAYFARLLERFANPALQHRTLQIAMDGSQKLPQRILGAVRDRLAAGASIERLALAVSAWLHFLRGVDEAGRACEISDPLAAALAQRLALADAQGSALADKHAAELHRVQTLLGFEPVFGSLGRDVRLAHAVARWTLSLREQGVGATLETLAQNRC